MTRVKEEILRLKEENYYGTFIKEARKLFKRNLKERVFLYCYNEGDFEAGEFYDISSTSAFSKSTINQRLIDKVANQYDFCISIHNHPSNSLFASENDMIFWENLNEYTLIKQRMSCVDNVIMGNKKYVSFNNTKYMHYWTSTDIFKVGNDSIELNFIKNLFMPEKALMYSVITAAISLVLSNL